MFGHDRDPRWSEFEGGWICSTCDEIHAGVFDLACFAPDFWQKPEVLSENADLTFEGDFLSEDFCIIDGEYFFVRCVFNFPLIGSDSRFGFGVWSSLSRTNFDAYVASFDEGMQADLGPWPGWLSNRLAGYPDTIKLKAMMQPQDGRQRPHLSLAADHAEHPLAVEQRDGMTFERLRDIYALYGHGALQSPAATTNRSN
jgi:hypothetical protein